jgi:predicted permease
MNIDAIVSLVSIYLFIGFGFLIKSRFKEKIDNKTLTLISVYILQPILTFWGLTLRPLDSSLLFAPFIHLIAIGTTLFLLLLFGSWVYKSDKKKEAIFVSMSLIGNTGNLGIPIGIAIFGVESVPYTSIINIANLFFVYTVGVYFLAKTEYSLKDSLPSV